MRVSLVFGLVFRRELMVIGGELRAAGRKMAVIDRRYSENAGDTPASTAVEIVHRNRLVMRREIVVQTS